MQLRFRRSVFRYLAELMFVLWTLLPSWSAGADKLVGLYSAHAVPYAMPWVADEMGLFKKYDLDFEFVYIPSSSTATAALLGGNVEVGLLGGIGVVNAFVNGATDLVLIGSIKNFGSSPSRVGENSMKKGLSTREI